MIDILSIIVLLVLLIILFKQIGYIKNLIVRARKSIGEFIIIGIFIIIIFLMAVLLAKSMIHYFIAIIGVLLMLLDFGKQGISKDGILIVSRGKELYQWNEIGSACISLNNEKLTVEYYSTSDVKIIKHDYSMKDKSNIYKIFSENNVIIK